MHNTIVSLDFHFNSNDIKLIKETQLNDAYSKMIGFGVLPQFNSQAPSNSEDKGFEFKSQNGEKLLVPLPDRLLFRQAINFKIDSNNVSLEKYAVEVSKMIKQYQEICGEFKSNRLSVVCQLVTNKPTPELTQQFHNIQPNYPWKEKQSDRLGISTLDEVVLGDEVGNLKVSIDTAIMEKYTNSEIVKETVFIYAIDVNTLDDRREYRFDIDKAASVWKEQCNKIASTINLIQDMIEK
jgi:hypothetical protein